MPIVLCACCGNPLPTIMRRETRASVGEVSYPVLDDRKYTLCNGLRVHKGCDTEMRRKLTATQVEGS
jgi:hypothetical protein